MDRHTMLSYRRGPDTPLLNLTTGEQLEQVAKRWPDRRALVSRHQHRQLSWAELLSAADGVARGLHSLGLEAGDRVGVWAVNCYEWVVLHFGCARAGMVLVSVSPACRLHELAFVLRKSRLKALFLRDHDERANYSDILNEARQGQDISLQHAICFESREWYELISAGDRVSSSAALDDVINIQYTSGTTGTPKGVLLTHRNLVNNGAAIARALHYSEEDRICIPVPLSHCFGNVIGTMAALASGAEMILPSGTFDAGATLEAVEAEKATSLYGVPTMFIAELRHPDFERFDLSSLRTGVMAGAPCPLEVMKQVIGRMGCRELTIGYGLTETSPIVTMSDVSDDIDRRVSTVGKAMPCTEIKVVSTVNGEIAPVGMEGEICARGYMVMKGYDDEPEATAQAIDCDGWLHTGDLGVMREDGYLKVTGRAKDMIIRGGENISPREIEEFLYTHPQVAEVHVTGLADECLGEIVLAWIRLRPGEAATAEGIRDFCQGRIAYFKVPAVIRFVDAFPTTLSGKIQKFRMREMEMGRQERALLPP
jgi:fatty-acyl-CoA synthase